MKHKTICKVIRAKIDAWLATIEDAAVRKLAEQNTIVTGGCIASMLLKEPINDFDLYFRNRDTCKAIAQYYIDRFEQKRKQGIGTKISIDDSQTDRIAIVVKSAGIASEEGTDEPYQYFESRPEGEAGRYVGEVMDDPGDIEDANEATTQAALENEDQDYHPVFLSTNAITLSGKIQLVTRFYGEPDDIHSNYDFVHVTNYWRSWDSELVLNQAALEALLSRELRYVGSKYPVCSVIRLRKFIKRGWTINAGQILKMLMQISDLDLKDPNVLRDQLTGVDAAYFMQLMTKLKEKNPEKVETAYLVEIIDRMF